MKKAATKPAPAAGHTYDYFRRKWENYDVDAALRQEDKELASGAAEVPPVSAKKPPGKSSHLAKPLGGYAGVVERLAGALDVVERPPDAASEKEKGNELFRKGQWAAAMDCYSRSIVLEPSSVAYANRAMAALKLKKYKDAEEDCTDALSLDDSYVKAFQRRGSARKALKKYESACSDFEAALQLEPANQELQRQLAEVQALLKDAGKATAAGNTKAARVIPEEPPLVAFKSRKLQPPASSASPSPVAKLAQGAPVKAQGGLVNIHSLEAPQDVRAPNTPTSFRARAEGTGLGAPGSQRPIPSAKESASSEAGAAHFETSRKEVQEPLRDAVSKQCLPADRHAAQLSQAELAVRLKEHDAVSLSEVAASAHGPVSRQIGALKGGTNVPSANPLPIHEKPASVHAFLPVETPPSVDNSTLAISASLAESLVKKRSPPANAYEFEARWKALTNQEPLRAALLRTLDPQALPKIIKHALTAPLLKDILMTLKNFFFPEHAQLAVSYLSSLTMVPRFDMTVLFFSARDKADIAEIWDARVTGVQLELKESLVKLRPKYKV